MNTKEAQRGVSTNDFKNKFGIALKEVDEAMYCGQKHWRQQEERLLKDRWINLKSGYVF
ncbi:MAG: hypothetical protein QMB11_03730 [Nonlabens sp.]|uniref:hypothetical protein n=1 Tax=Nonlabens sp. TaxID=1888209 RepID=UPI0035A5C79C